ncbi:MAG: hypothetical protein ACLFUZ_00650 [Candidatus Micrarchaeia archaeon]
MEEKLEEFEEIEESPAKEQNFEQQPKSEGFGSGGSGGGERPDFRVMQPDRDKDGNSILKNVGGMWKKTSKNGNEFYVLNIGRMTLLVFKNDKQGGFNE